MTLYTIVGKTQFTVIGSGSCFKVSGMTFCTSETNGAKIDIVIGFMTRLAVNSGMNSRKWKTGFFMQSGNIGYQPVIGVMASFTIGSNSLLVYILMASGTIRFGIFKLQIGMT